MRRRRSTTKFVVFFSYTSHTWKGLTTAPENRTKTVAATFEAAGGSLLSLYSMLGPHDGMRLVEELLTDAE